MNYEKLPKTISAEELLSTPLPPVKWIIPDLLPAGLALFAGPSKAGKSWLTLWLCLQVAQGKPMWGREIEPHTVLYLSLEDTFNRLQKRLLQLVGSEEAPERLVMQTECGSIGQGLEEQLTSFLYQHPDTGLIVIDTLQKVRSSDQNNSMWRNAPSSASSPTMTIPLTLWFRFCTPNCLTSCFALRIPRRNSTAHCRFMYA